MESDVFVLLSRLIAAVGRVVMLARLRKQMALVTVVCMLLDMVCHVMAAIEKALLD